MTNEEAIKKLTAIVHCTERTASGIDEDCNCERCDNCSLLYEQGNIGERREALKTAISALQTQDVPDTNVGDMISRADAIDALSRGIITEKDDAYLLLESPYECNSMIEWAVEVLKTLPSAQPEQKTGRWIKEPNCYYRCSECGYER